ncbi:DUF1819 family protein [Pelobacter propionicus]|uniref:DUF1819 family protein n=1 Tax=Pelobacter propionicus TaxID=29543 RepID=UPI0012ED6516|nr:DUF1819 family protein [Pelobacter propionicus]
MNVAQQLYNAEITAGSLLLKESRAIAQLLLQSADETAWRQAIAIDNILQKTSPASAKRMSSLIRKRLELMPRELWSMIADGTTEVAIQSLMAAAIKHSRLLGDFMLKVLQRHYREFNPKILSREWDSFLAECAHIDPAVASWSQSTRKKVGQVAYRILSEAGYLDNTRSLKLQPVLIAPEVSKFLNSHDEKYILKCMEIAHE